MRQSGSHHRIAALLFLLASSACNGVFYHPDQHQRLTPTKLGLGFEDVALSASDGTRLHGWYIPTIVEPRRGAVLHFHGNAENITSHVLFFAWLVEHGYDLFVFDYRGFGRSAGEPSRSGLILDGVAAINWMRNRIGQRDGGFFIIGQSLGGAVAVPALVEAGTHRVDGVVLESTFASYRAIARDKLASFWLTWPFRWPHGFLISDDYSARDYVSRVDLPILFFHSESDFVVPYKSGLELFAAAREPKEMVLVEWGGHASAFVGEDGRYRARLLEFFNANASRP